MEGKEMEGEQLANSFTPLWRRNEQKSLKSGPHGTIFWVRENQKFKEYERDGALVGAKAPSKFVTGNSYAGDWLEDKKHGFGTQTWSNGNKYQGDFRFGKRDGTGTLWIKDGSKLRKAYSGSWKGNMRHGTGILYERNGDKYQGNWVKGKKHGRGKLFYANGDMYQGEFVADQRHGLGILTLANGDRFEGHWEHDQKQGPGRFFYVSTQKVLEAEWVDGVPRCGVFSHQHEDEEKQDSGFDLPELHLEDPQNVLRDALQQARKVRAEKRGSDALGQQPDESLSAFSGEEMREINAAFDAVAQTRDSIKGSQLVDLLHILGIFPAQDDIDALLQRLGATEKSDISCQAFVGLLTGLKNDIEEEDEDEE